MSSSLWLMGFSSCAVHPTKMWDLSPPSRDQTHFVCIARQILNHWKSHRDCHFLMNMILTPNSILVSRDQMTCMVMLFVVILLFTISNISSCDPPPARERTVSPCPEPSSVAMRLALAREPWRETPSRRSQGAHSALFLPPAAQATAWVPGAVPPNGRALWPVQDSWQQEREISHCDLGWSILNDTGNQWKWFLPRCLLSVFLHYPWGSHSKNTGVVCHSLFQ